ncbi:MAG: ATP-binding protein [candidate division KSB1 bacterium]|nr:ATP-binding protein [candidate division KSB1 bacterium]
MNLQRVKEENMSMQFSQPGVTKPLKRSAIPIFFRIFLPFAILLIMSSVYLFWQEKRHQKVILEQYQLQQIDLQKRLIVNELNPVMSDLFYLGHLIRKNSYLSTGATDHKRALTDALLTFSDKKTAYNRIQVIDKGGRHVLDVYKKHGMPPSIASSDRPSESQRGVRESLALNREDIYMSEFYSVPEDSLRISSEHYLTFAVPIFSASGERLGAVIVQYIVNRLVSHLRKMSVKSDSDWFLINRVGNEVFHSEKAGISSPFSFAELFPEAWQIIREGKNGQFQSRQGLFTFTTIYPDSERQEILLSTSKAATAGSVVSRQAIQNVWKLISFLPAGEIEAVSPQFLRRLYLVNIILMIILVGLSWGLTLVVVKRKEAEQALKYREIEFRDLFENAPNGILTLDASGRILRANRRIEDILKISLDEIIGCDIDEFFLKIASFPNEALRLLKRLKLGEHFHNEQLEIQKEDGQRGWISLSVTAILTSNGEIVGQRISLLDISHQKLLELQLQQSLKMEAIGRLAGGIAHDFNNLLTVMAGYMDLIQEQFEKNDPLYQDLDQVCKAIDRASELTQQLLAFSRRQIVRPRIINFNDVVRTLEKMLRRILGEDIEFHADLDTKLDNVYADPAQIEQIIMNLVVNARDAMPEGGILSIETCNVELDADYARTHMGVEPGRYVMLSVSDTGIGMDKETISHIFEPFFSTKKEGMGTGLGLSMVYGIVRQNKGTIWVYSEPGKGTTFKIYFPRAGKAMDTIIEEEQETINLKGNETILLVEDEEAVRKLARRCLQENGYTVISASHGKEALNIIRQSRPQIDIMVTDIIMPGMSGKELYEQVSRLIPGVRVLYISGYTDNAIVHYGVLEPGTNFLQKPFKPDALLKKIRQTLEKPKQGD